MVGAMWAASLKVTTTAPTVSRGDGSSSGSGRSPMAPPRRGLRRRACPSLSGGSGITRARARRPAVERRLRRTRRAGPAAGVAQSPPRSRSFSIACGSAGAIIANCSRQARGLPGMLMISVVPRSPLTARESIACGVLASEPARIASAKPGAGRSSTSSVASGVTSRAVKPVPPVVRTRLASVSSAKRVSSAAICVALVGHDGALDDRRRPARASSSSSAAPLSSSRSPREPLSETVSTAARISERFSSVDRRRPA